MQNTDYLKVFGNHLRILREERNLTQTELAHKIGKDRQNYQRLELGTANPTLLFLLSVAQGLEITLPQLLDFEIPSK